jgi:hypothetical protein
LKFYIGRAFETKAVGGFLLSCWRSIREKYVDEFYEGKVSGGVGINEDGTLDDELFADIFVSVNRKSSTGVPVCYEYQTNESYLEDNGIKLRAEVEKRIKLRLQGGYEGLDAIELVERGYHDPVRVFGKDEATSITKPTRVINSVSIVDSCVERATSLRRTQMFSDNWIDGLSTVGIQLKDVEAMVEFREVSERQLGRVVENTDVRGWEWSFNRDCHEIAFDIEFYLETGRFPDGNYQTVYEKLLYADFYLSLADGLVVCSDGVVLLTIFCWLRSGKFRTSFQGTHVRAALCSIVASMERLPTGMEMVSAKANGDDCLNRFIRDYTYEYKLIGFTITDRVVSVDSDPWSFCSHSIFRNTHYPETISKILCNFFRHDEITPELFDQLMFAFKDHPGFSEIKAFVLRVVWASEQSDEALTNQASGSDSS